MGKKAYCTMRSRRPLSKSPTPIPGFDDGSPAVSDKLLVKTKPLKESLEPLLQDSGENKGNEMKKRIKHENLNSSTCNVTEVTEYDLALTIIALEKLGYLSKIDRVTEDDESLIQFGDKFGLSVVNDFPEFFKLVPQHPHYGQMSLDHVNEANAENYWDLFMPLIHRGLSAVRNNNDKEIAAVERRITRFTTQGFNMTHLQAYINIFRHLKQDHSSLVCAHVKVDEEIQTEKKKIDRVMAGKSVEVEIKELESERFRYQKLIADIDASLVCKRKMLEEEKSIRSTSTTPVYEILLRSKEDLEKMIAETVNKAKALMVEHVMTAITKAQINGMSQN